MAAPGGGVPQFASLYVGDLHPDVTEAMLYEIFNSVGPVASIRVCRDSVSRKSLGYGYVNFHNVSDAERALDTLNYSSIKGRSCRIMWSQRDPSLRKSGAGNIYVKNLDKNIDNKALYDTFSLFGNILSCKVATDPTGNSYGYGFVHYETEEASKQAIEKVDGMMIGERTVQVCLFQKRDEKDGVDKENFTNIYVKNFPSEWDDDKLMSIFSEFGPVASHALRKDAKGRAFAFVAFEDVESAKKAVAEMHLKDVRSEEAKASDTGEERLGPDGHPENKMYCQRAQSKAERQAELRSKFASMDASKGGVNLYVKNLDDSIDEAGLKELFEPFGTITSAAVPLDSNGKCKGFGFVCFGSPDEATKAVTDMHLKVIKGKPLYVGLAEKREARQERLRQRYAPGPPGGGKGMGGKGEGKGGKGGNNPNMGGMMGMMPQQAMMGMMRPPMMGMMPPQMMGKGAPMAKSGGGPMMGMMGKGGPMMMPGKGGQMPMMPAMPMGMNPMMPMRPPMPGNMMPPRPGAPGGGSGPLNAAALANASPTVQKQMIGEKLFPAISKMQPELAGKITGMMLEMDNSELLMLLESESQLKQKVDEAMRVLQTAKN
eukprot:CAMPEP_0181504302 /NCGR_PEP_ID=MMETSP1110-20121109/57431_1 /TAXON_ID=174948 /ORGANISM="Symbiodinium sp., Strain CCMP421" /LENGTH=599 /DNA_ID=CAMNT_0023633169 /DNA_START=78 /DNA_END=1877 /DNA_ORIENTATION=+